MKKSVQTIVLVAAVSLFACNSPLLEHANAQDPGIRAAEKSNSQKGCQLSFPQHGLCAELVWNQLPNDQDASTFTLRFWKSETATASGPYASPADSVFVKLWMPAMGHGSSPVTLTTEKDSVGQAIPGVYAGSNVYFIMPGAWQVKVQLRQNGGTVTEEADLDVQI